MSEDATEVKNRKLESVTQREELDEFLTQAIMAEQQFFALRDVKIVDHSAAAVDREGKDIDMSFEYDSMPVPRR